MTLRSGAKYLFVGLVFVAGLQVKVALGETRPETETMRGTFVNGITLEAPPQRVDGQWARELKELHGNWVAIVPYALTRSGESRVYYNLKRRQGRHGQWWGEQPEGVAEQIRQAKASGLAVLLKPQVWFSRSWAGDFSLDTEQKWKQWESDYTAYLEVIVDLARELQVEMLCLGTELRHSFRLRGMVSACSN